MGWRWSRRADGTVFCVSRPVALSAAVACALALAACQLENQPNLTAAQPRGASVAFDSIDGLPRAQFQKLVQDLNYEAQTRRLAVVSREKPSAYRIRGYLAAEVVKDKTTVSWVWDVFDRNQKRALRITGSDVTSGTGWQAVDAATLSKIARSSMDQLTAFLTSPAAVPGTPAHPQLALVSSDASTPEAAGIFRIFRPHADPIPAADAEPAGDTGIVATPASQSVPLPRRRPVPAEAVSTNGTLTLAAARRAAR